MIDKPKKIDQLLVSSIVTTPIESHSFIVRDVQPCKRGNQDGLADCPNSINILYKIESLHYSMGYNK